MHLKHLPQIATNLGQPEVLGAAVWAGHSTSDAHLGAVSTENLVALRLVAAVRIDGVATTNDATEHVVEHGLIVRLVNFAGIYELVDLLLCSLHG